MSPTRNSLPLSPGGTSSSPRSTRAQTVTMETKEKGKGKGKGKQIDERDLGLTVLKDWFSKSVIIHPTTSLTFNLPAPTKSKAKVKSKSKTKPSPPSDPNPPPTRNLIPSPTPVSLLALYIAYTSTPLPSHVPVANIDAFLGFLSGCEGLVLEGPSVARSGSGSSSSSLLEKVGEGKEKEGDGDGKADGGDGMDQDHDQDESMDPIPTSGRSKRKSKPALKTKLNAEEAIPLVIESSSASISTSPSAKAEIDSSASSHHYTHLITNITQTPLTFSRVEEIWDNAGSEERFVDWGKRMLSERMTAMGIRSKEESGNLSSNATMGGGKGADAGGQKGTEPSEFGTETGGNGGLTSGRMRFKPARLEVYVVPNISNSTDSTPPSPTPTTPVPSASSFTPITTINSINHVVGPPAPAAEKPVDSSTNEIPDSWFTVSAELLLPVPSCSFRRKFDKIRAVEKVENILLDRERDKVENILLDGKGLDVIGGEGIGSKEIPDGPYHRPTEVLGYHDPTSQIGRMFYCKQIVGEEGAKIFAESWVKMCIHRPSTTMSTTTIGYRQRKDPLTLSQLHKAYLDYAYHPPEVPKVSMGDLGRMIFASWEMGKGVEVPALDDEREVEIVAGVRVIGEQDSAVLTAAEGNDDEMSAELPPQKTSIGSINFYNITILPFSKIPQKDHVSLWQDIGFNWKRYHGSAALNIKRAADRAAKRLEKTIREEAVEKERKEREERLQLERGANQVTEKNRMDGLMNQVKKIRKDGGWGVGGDGAALEMGGNKGKTLLPAVLRSANPEMEPQSRLMERQSGGGYPGQFNQAQEHQQRHHLTQHQRYHPYTSSSLSLAQYPIQQQRYHHPQHPQRQAFPSPGHPATRLPPQPHQPQSHNQDRSQYTAQAQGSQGGNLSAQTLRNQPGHARYEQMRNPSIPAPSWLVQAQAQHEYQQQQLEQLRIQQNRDTQQRQFQTNNAQRFPPHIAEQSVPVARPRGAAPPLVPPQNYGKGRDVFLPVSPEGSPPSVVQGDPVMNWLTKEYTFFSNLSTPQREVWLSFVNYVTSLGPDLAKKYRDIQPHSVFQVIVGKFGCKVVKRPGVGENQGKEEYVIEGMGRRGW